MKILKLLWKYHYEIKLNKTELYNFVNQGSKEIEQAGFEYKVKLPVDLFAYEVILNGIRSRKAIDECYDQFMADNYDLFDHVNYQQRQKILFPGMEEVISKLPVFEDRASKTTIAIPYLEPFINKYYLNDYPLITLKQHQTYIKEYSKKLDVFIELYGMQPYDSKFSTLQLVGHENDNYYFYHHDFKVVYQFNNNKIVNELCLIDKYTNEYPDLTALRTVVKMIDQEADENEILEYLFEHKFIGEKTYKKIKKKLK